MSNPNHPGQIRAIKDFTERQVGATISLDSSFLKWLVRNAAWTLTTLHVAVDGMTAHQRIRDKVFDQQIAVFGVQILFQTTQDTRTAAETRYELSGRLLARSQREDGRTHREQQCSSAVASKYSETKQRRALEPRYVVVRTRKSL